MTGAPAPGPAPAGVDPATLAAGYAECAALTRRHGTTYFWGAALLPVSQRRHVHAVYALCRLADDIVDAPDATSGGTGRVAETRRELAEFAAEFRAAVDDPGAARPVMAAVGTSVRAAGIDLECFERFFGAMSMDLDTTSYETWGDLLGYMEGSAAVIGEMMLPVLRPTSPAAKEPARALGLAFQLTNFLRDVGEDLGRGRVYVPQEDLRRFGADPARRIVDEAWRDLMRFEIARNRELYAAAVPGLAYLPGASGRCVAAAHRLYAQILTRIERHDYDVFSGRVRVPTWRKATTALVGTVVRPRVGADVAAAGAGPAPRGGRDSA